MSNDHAPHPWSQTLEAIGRSRFTALLVRASTSTTSPASELYADFFTVYLRRASGDHLRLESVNSRGGLAVSLTDTVDSPDDDALTFLVDLSAQYFNTWDILECTAVTYSVNEDSDLAAGIVRGMELQVSGDWNLIFDPMGVDGIMITSTAMQNAWAARHTDPHLTTHTHTWWSQPDSRGTA